MKKVNPFPVNQYGLWNTEDDEFPFLETGNTPEDIADEIDWEKRRKSRFINWLEL